MLLARVVGNVWGAKKADSLEGYRLLVVRPLTARPSEATAAREVMVDADDPRLHEAEGTVVVADRLGAGPGELVLVAHGSRCRDITLGPGVATKELVIAIVDRANVEVSP